MKFSVLKLASFREAEILVLPDDDVIEGPDRNCLTGGLDLLRDLVILAAWFGLSGRMVMDQNEIRRVLQQSLFDNLHRGCESPRSV